MNPNLSNASAIAFITALVLFGTGCDEATNANREEGVSKTEEAPTASVTPLSEEESERVAEIVEADFTFDPALVFRWWESLDWNSPALAEVRKVLKSEGGNAAFHLWVLEKLDAMRTADFHQFGWHDYHIHPTREAIAELLVGGTSFEEYYSQPNPKIQSLDIYGIAEAVGGEQAKPIEWFQDRRRKETWEGFPEMSATERMNKSEHITFEIFPSLAGRFWKTEDAHYRKAALRILADFHDRHASTFWKNYAEEFINDQAVRFIYQADWRSNTNGLHEGWNAINTFRILAALAKASGDERPASWSEIIRPIGGTLKADALDQEEIENTAKILLGLLENYPEKLQWFALGNSIANQKMEALKALAYLKLFLPEAKATAAFGYSIDAQLAAFFQTNFLPDGGMIEQSLNYNEGTADKIRYAPGGNALSQNWKENGLERFDRMLAALRDPLGNLPQIGNNKIETTEAVWKDRESWDSHRATLDSIPQEGSVSFPYSGYHVLRNGGDFDSSYLFFKNSRRQRGHLARDNNGIQLTAFGRPLLVGGGPPDYGRSTHPDAIIASDYLGESSSLKANTILFNGHSQADPTKPLTQGPLSPITTAWFDSEDFAVVDGVFEGPYTGVALKNEGSKGGNARHHRTVYFFKKQNAFLLVDEITPETQGTHTYTQVWNFPPELKTRKFDIAGFAHGEFAHDEAGKTIQTTDPDGPNVTLIHDGQPDLRYASWFGDRENALGWFAPAIFTAFPAMDYHVTWEATGPTTLLTWIVPTKANAASPVHLDGSLENTPPLNSRIRLPDGTILGYETARSESIAEIPENSPSVWIHDEDQPEKKRLLVNHSREGNDSLEGISEYLLEDGQWSLVHRHPTIQAVTLDTPEYGDRATVIEIPANTGGARVIGNGANDSPEDLTPGESVLLEEGETLAVWHEELENHPTYRVVLPDTAPLPNPLKNLPEAARPGLLKKTRSFAQPRRIYDGTLRTLFAPESTEIVEDPFSQPLSRNTVSVFEGWLSIEEAGSYTFELSAMRSGMINFRASEDTILPPFLESKNGEPAGRTVRLDKGHYSIVLTITGFYGTTPRIEFSITPEDSSQPIDLRFHAPVAFAAKADDLGFSEKPPVFAHHRSPAPDATFNPVVFF